MDTLIPDQRAVAGKAIWQNINTTTKNKILMAWLPSSLVYNLKKYAQIKRDEVRFEETMTEDADYIIVAFGSAARIAAKAISICRANGIKVGLLRPITLFPFPTLRIQQLAEKVKGILCVEINAGQMVQDVRLASEGRCPVAHYGRMGGIVPTPDDIINALNTELKA